MFVKLLAKFSVGVLFLLLLLVSCSPKNSFQTVKKSSLKDRAVILNSTVSWTENIEKDSCDILSKEISSEICLNPIAQLAILSNNKIQKNYPRLDNFTSLDISSYTDSQFEILNNFCGSLIKNKTVDSFFAKGFVFTFPLFKYNLKSSGKNISDMSFYLIGKADSVENECRCPVRFLFKDNSYCDVYLYLTKTASEWKINQIDFMKKG